MQVDEYDISAVREGMSVFVSLDSYKDSLFEARISRIYPIMNERSRTFTVEAIFTRRPPRLYPNLTAEASIVLQTHKNVPNIPRSYLINDSFVLLKGGEKRAVKTGLKDFSKIEIVSGLRAGDAILKPE